MYANEYPLQCKYLKFRFLHSKIISKPGAGTIISGLNTGFLNVTLGKYCKLALSSQSLIYNLLSIKY